MKKIIYPSIAGLIIVIGFSFFWFEMRPAKIKHDCSWVLSHVDEMPADKGVTKEQADMENKKINCTESDTPRICELSKVQVRPARVAIPAKDYYRQASEKEYIFCLRDKGL